MPDERSPLLQNRPQNEYTTPEPLGDSAIEQQAQDPPRKSHLVFVGCQILKSSIGLIFLLLRQVIPMAIGIFLTAMDQTIIVSCMSRCFRNSNGRSTYSYFWEAYASIGNELNQLQNTSWIATAYLLTITSFQ
jgi:hypothetical protein